MTFDPTPFTLGVASGDPTPDGVILWTRVAPEPTRHDGGVTGDVSVDWMVALDPDLSTVVASGTEVATATWGHSVHVDVGGLDPATTYYYAFSALGATSRIGRTKTAPVTADRVRFAFASCQQFEAGYYGAYRHLAAEDLDVVVHLGDYIYETDHSGGVRRPGGGVPETLEDFRVRHATYKGDPDLRAAHAAHPWVVTWDDHEIRNNYAGGAEPASFDALQAAAYQAYYEHLPIRAPEGPPDGPDFRLYRQAAFGGLVDLMVLDTRQYRDEQPCGGSGLAVCSEVDDPDRTILGAEQEAWLLDRLSSTGAAWKVLANQVEMAPFQIGGTPEALDAIPGAVGLADGVDVSVDSWSGYQAERTALLRHLAEEGIEDVVVVTGDAHRHFVNDLKVDFDDPRSPIVATEFLGTSISTRSGDNTNQGRALLYPNNNHTRFYEGEERGFALCDVSRDRWRTDYKILTASPNDPDAGLTTLASFELERGEPAVQQVAGGGGNPFPRLTLDAPGAASVAHGRGARAPGVQGPRPG